MSEQENLSYDAAGVLLTPLRNGRFKAERVAVKDGQVIVLHVITTDRNLTWAHENAMSDFRGLSTSIHRGTVPLIQAEPLSLKAEDE